jgi:hypothetical protein
MENEILFIIEFVRGSPLTQWILLTALAIFLLAVWKEFRALRKKRRQDRAILSSPILCAEEVFPYGYMQRPRGSHFPPTAFRSSR